MVFIDEPLHSREEAIRFISEKAYQMQLLSDVDSFINIVFEREKQIATSVGYNIAIPHGKGDVVREPFVAYVRAHSAFEWDEETKDIVQSIFLIGVPEKDAGMTHLRYISQVSRKLINEEFRKQLFACHTAQDAFQYLDSINVEINKGDK